MLERARKRLDKRAKRGLRGYPVATVALYGPDAGAPDHDLDVFALLFGRFKPRPASFVLDHHHPTRHCGALHIRLCSRLAVATASKELI
jgi:hypothetical protein